MNVSSKLSTRCNNPIINYLTPSKALEEVLSRKTTTCAKKNIESAQSQKDPLDIPLNQKVTFGLSILSLAGNAYFYAGGSSFPSLGLGLMLQAYTGYSLVQSCFKGPLTQTAFTLTSMGLTFTPLKPLMLGMFTYNMLADSYEQAKKSISLCTEDNKLTVARNLFVYMTNSILSTFNFVQSLPKTSSPSEGAALPLSPLPSEGAALPLSPLPSEGAALPLSPLPSEGAAPPLSPTPTVKAALPFSGIVDEVPVYSASFANPTCALPISKMNWLFKNRAEYQEIIQPVLDTALKEVNKEQLTSSSPILTERRTFDALQKLIHGGTVLGGNKPIAQSIVHKGFSKLLPSVNQISEYKSFKWSRSDVALFVKNVFLDPITNAVRERKVQASLGLAQEHLSAVENQYTSQIPELERQIWDSIPRAQKV
jgi:hypothetical protein